MFVLLFKFLFFQFSPVPLGAVVATPFLVVVVADGAVPATAVGALFAANLAGVRRRAVAVATCKW